MSYWLLKTIILHWFQGWKCISVTNYVHRQNVSWSNVSGQIVAAQNMPATKRIHKLYQLQKVSTRKRIGEKCIGRRIVSAGKCMGTKRISWQNRDRISGDSLSADRTYRRIKKYWLRRSICGNNVPYQSGPARTKRIERKIRLISMSTEIVLPQKKNVSWLNLQFPYFNGS
jgi:hypothetical protein